MLLNRIRDPIEKLLRPNQNGYRKGRSTLEPILTLRRMNETISVKKDKRLYVVFVDFTKAFDSINGDRMFLILAAYGIPAFAVNTGVLQGDTLAPFLFTIVLDYVIRQAICN